MDDTDRKAVMELDRQRRSLRAAFSDDVVQARHDLHPRTLKQRWVERRRKQMAGLTNSGKQNLKKNAPLIGLAGTAILLFAARKPISRAMKQLRAKARQTKDRTS